MWFVINKISNSKVLKPNITTNVNPLFILINDMVTILGARVI